MSTLNNVFGGKALHLLSSLHSKSTDSDMVCANTASLTVKLESTN